MLNIIIKNSLLIFIAFTLPLLTFSQKADTINYSNRVFVYVDAVSGSAFFTTLISKKWFLGGGAGLGGSCSYVLIGPDNYTGPNMNTKSLQKIIHADVITNYEANKNFNIDIGIDASFSWYGEVPRDDEGSIQGLIGGFITALYGWKHFKIGTQLSISALKPRYNGVVKPMRLLIYSTPLILTYKIRY